MDLEQLYKRARRDASFVQEFLDVVTLEDAAPHIVRVLYEHTPHWAAKKMNILRDIEEERLREEGEIPPDDNVTRIPMMTMQSSILHPLGNNTPGSSYILVKEAALDYDFHEFFSALVVHEGTHVKQNADKHRMNPTRYGTELEAYVAQLRDNRMSNMMRLDVLNQIKDYLGRIEPGKEHVHNEEIYALIDASPENRRRTYRLERFIERVESEAWRLHIPLRW